MERIKPHLFAFFIFLISAVYITFPLIFHLGDFVTGFGDELVITWIQNWVIHALSSNPFSLFEANTYYPFHNSLAFSDLFLTSSILSYLPTKLIGEPVAAFNFTLIFSIVFLGFSIYVFTYHVTKELWASLFSGLLVIFSPAVLDKSVHLQILSIFWVVFSVLFFIIFINTQKYRYLIFSSIFFIFQVYNSFLPGYFILAWNLFIYIFYFFYKRKDAVKLIRFKYILTIVIAFILVIPAVVPYYEVSHQFNYVRDIRETIHFALQPEDLVYTNSYSRLKDILLFLFPVRGYPSGAELKPGYIGFIFSSFVIFSLFYFIKKIKKKDFLLKSFWLTSLFGLILSFGPALHINRLTIHHPFPIILPYALFYYIIPGFKGIRNSARWEMLFILSMAIIIGIFLSKILKNKSSLGKAIIYLILLTFVVGEYNFPMQFKRVTSQKDFPKVYSWLLTTSADSSFIEMPIFNWDMAPYSGDEIMKQYYSTIHFRKMVNGYSGFSPPQWQKLVRYELANFPSLMAISKLRMIGVDYIIVDKNKYDMLNKEKFKINKQSILDGEKIINELNNYNKVDLIEKFDNIYVYKIR